MFVDIETVVFRNFTKSDSFMKIVDYCMKNKIRLVMVAAVPLGSWEGNYDMLISEEDNRRMKELHQKYPWITRNCVGQKMPVAPLVMSFYLSLQMVMFNHVILSGLVLEI